MYVEFSAGDWVQISNVDFDRGVKLFEAQVASTTETRIDLFLDSISGSPAASIAIEGTGELTLVLRSADKIPSE